MTRRKYLVGAILAGGLSLGLATPALATDYCPCPKECPPPPPPPKGECKPGWGGQGGPKAGYAGQQGGAIPGDGTGDHNHTHCGPPGQAKKAG